MSTPAEHHDMVTASALRQWPLPQPGGSKYSRGRVLVVGGSPSTPGAVMLGGLAALRVGAGVLALAVARTVAAPVAAAVPEASVTGLPSLDGSTDADDVEDALGRTRAVLVGPGIDNPDSAQRLLQRVVDDVGDSTAVGIDAFALGVVGRIKGIDKIAGRCLFTPNSVEAAHILDVEDVGDRDASDVAAEIADRFGAVVSFHSHIAAPDGRRWIVPTGHPGLGTSGSGDVLAGAAAGLLARGADPAQAACWATYLHATAGDRLAARVGRLGFLARELVDELPLVIVETEA